LPVAPPPPADDNDPTSLFDLGAAPPPPEAVPTFETQRGVASGDAAFVIDIGPRAPSETAEPFVVAASPTAIDAPASPPLVDEAFDIDVGTGRFNAPVVASAASSAPEAPVAAEPIPVVAFGPPADEGGPTPGLPVAVGLDVGEESFGEVPLLVVDEVPTTDAPHATSPFANIETAPAAPGAAALPPGPGTAVADDPKVGELTVDGFSVDGFTVDGATVDAQTVKDGLAIDGAPPGVRSGNGPALADVATTTPHASFPSEELDVDFAVEPEAILSTAAPAATADVNGPAMLAAAAPAGAADVDVTGDLPPVPAIDLSVAEPVPRPAAAGDGSLSSRAGALAESLEGEGRFSEATLLYEIQNVLTAIGR
jgi:hypothetical protein